MFYFVRGQLRGDPWRRWSSLLSGSTPSTPRLVWLAPTWLSSESPPSLLPRYCLYVDSIAPSIIPLSIFYFHDFQFSKLASSRNTSSWSTTSTWVWASPSWWPTLSRHRAPPTPRRKCLESKPWTHIEYLSKSFFRINKQLDEEEAALKAIRQDEIDACLAQVLGYKSV